jgi:hypothetical protein
MLYARPRIGIPAPAVDLSPPAIPAFDHHESIQSAERQGEKGGRKPKTRRSQLSSDLLISNPAAHSFKIMLIGRTKGLFQNGFLVGNMDAIDYEEKDPGREEEWQRPHVEGKSDQ